MSSKYTLSLVASSWLVVASMVGTGIFTTTGLLADALHSPVAIMVVWLLAGVLALAGALVYAELCARFPRNGGEYALLSEIYHPAMGFIAGVVSLVVGFGATIAVSAAAFTKYLGSLLPQTDERATSVALVIILTAVHSLRTQRAAGFQNWMTGLRYGSTALAAVVAIWLGWRWEADSWQKLESSFAWQPRSLALGILWVSYSYSGWNAAAYVAGEVHEPRANVPRALTYGTVAVVALYAVVNLAYLLVIPMNQLSGSIDVARLAAYILGGSFAAQIVASLVAFGLISTAGAYIMVGARVYEVIAEDFSQLHWFRRKEKQSHANLSALWVQATIASALLLSSTFEGLLTYVGFTLSLFSGLTVFGLFIVRLRERHNGNNTSASDVYRTWGYPWTPLAFVLVTVWIIYDATRQQPLIALSGFSTFALGAFLYLVVTRRYRS